MRPGRGVADRAPLRLVEHHPAPAWVPVPERPRAGPVVLLWAGAVAAGWFTCVGIAWTAYAICRVSGVCR